MDYEGEQSEAERSEVASVQSSNSTVVAQLLTHTPFVARRDRYARPAALPNDGGGDNRMDEDMPPRDSNWTPAALPRGHPGSDVARGGRYEVVASEVFDGEGGGEKETVAKRRQQQGKGGRNSGRDKQHVHQAGQRKARGS